MSADIELIKETFENRIDYGVVTVNGADIFPPMTITTNANDEIIVELSLNDEVTGNISKAKLILDNGQILRERINLGNKDSGYTLLVGFKWKLSAADEA